MAIYGPPLYGPHLYGVGGDVSSIPYFENEMQKKRDTTPLMLIEHIDVNGVVTDISRYYVSGANITRQKERAPDEIQAGDFDITLINHDDYFSEYKAGSLFYDVQYHFSRIRVSAGFVLPDGSTVTEPMAYGYIDELEAHEGESYVTLRCRDLIHRIIDEKLHHRSADETPDAGGGNVGDGTCSVIDTKPFAVQDEDWTLTCTTPGADGVAVFSVVGSVSGNIGDATSGTQFSDDTAGIRFTIRAGSTPWSGGDTFTFSSKGRPQWTQENPVKIIWAILTGYNYDTDVQESWAAGVFDLDHTQSDDNTDIDYASFVNAVDQVSGTVLTGFIDYDEPARDVLESLLLLFLGSLFTNADGKIVVKTWSPSLEGVARVFADSAKITECGYVRSVNEIINHVVVSYKKTANWEFSGDEIVYDGRFIEQDGDSVAKYGKLSEEYISRWYMSGGTHVEDLADRLLSRYAEPPLVIAFRTGTDGLLSEIGDKIYVTDDKWGFALAGAEISRITKSFDQPPMKVAITARRDTSMDTIYGYWGSRADEGDGISPQADTYSGASATDKLFCYLGRGYKMY